VRHLPDTCLQSVERLENVEIEVSTSRLSSADMIVAALPQSSLKKILIPTQNENKPLK
jgi:hypothetical protein